MELDQSLPEDLTTFRLGQLLLVLERLDSGVNLERLGYYDFFVANPMLIDDLEQVQRTELVLAGFDSRTIDYQSAAHRFANRRRRLRADLGSLIAYGLVVMDVGEGIISYRLTDRGIEASNNFSAHYADAIRQSLDLIMKKLKKLSDRRLRSSADRWLRAERFDLDLIGVDQLERGEAPR